MRSLRRWTNENNFDVDVDKLLEDVSEKNCIELSEKVNDS